MSYDHNAVKRDSRKFSNFLDFWRKLHDVETSLKAVGYRGIFESPAENRPSTFWPPNALVPERIFILGQTALGPPHGLDLVTLPTPTLPQLPTVPEPPEAPSTEVYKKFQLEVRLAEYQQECQQLREKIEHTRATIEARILQEQAEGMALSVACKAGDYAAIRRLMLTTLVRHPLPKVLMLDSDFSLDAQARVALGTIWVPDFVRLAWLKMGLKRWSPISASAQKRESQKLLRSLCIRAAYLIAMSDPGDFFETVAINAHQKWFDPATGEPREGIVASLQAKKDDLRRLQPGHLDADACFRHLGGIATPNILNAAPVRPIFVMNTDDKRVIANRDVAGQLSAEANLAAMPWEDFEHLVRQLFEWMFASEGVEVKVTRASRDRGVDAIVFDPDPIRGGKYVIQAKRYTRTVDVAAVRDLYGTVVNEGANRGILVTTASYGPDSYEFAKDKPISLIDGPNLLVLLQKHGRNYRINLQEARQLGALD